MENQEYKEISVYEYFNSCKNNKRKAVALITDKQYLFCVQKDEDTNFYHDRIYTKMEKEIHPELKNMDWPELREKDVYLASLGKELIIFLPTSKLISMGQYMFLCEILNQISKFNECEDNKIYIYVSGSRYIDENKQIDIQMIKECLYKSVGKDIELSEEKIVGKTQDKKLIENSIEYNIGFDMVKTMYDLESSLEKFKIYQDDNYYNKLIKTVFKDYDQVKTIVKIFKQCHKNIKLENVNFNNILKILIENINVLISRNNIDNLKKIALLFLDSEIILKKDLEKQYHDFYKIADFILNLNIKGSNKKNYINYLFTKAKNYDEIVNIIVNIKYYQELNDIELCNNEINYYDNYLNNKEHKSKIIKDSDKIISLIDTYYEFTYLIHMFKNTINSNINDIKSEKNNIYIEEDNIKKLSNTKFKEFINKKNIRNSKRKIESANSTIDNIKNINNELEKKIQEIEEEKLKIEKQLKGEYNFIKIPSIDMFNKVLDEISNLKDEEVISKIELLKTRLNNLKSSIKYLQDNFEINNHFYKDFAKKENPIKVI